MKISAIKRVNCIWMIMIMAFVLWGCGSPKGDSSDSAYFYNSLNDKEDGSEEVESDAEAIEQELYLIVGINSVEGNMRVYRYANGLEYQYYYGMNTEFCNKYGDHTSIINFKLGDAIFLSETDSQGKVSKVTKADTVWNYDDISKFTVAEDGSYIQVGDEKYMVEKDTYVFSGEEQTAIADITTDDKLSMVGKGNQILSVSVVTGHGSLELVNTELFEGSFLQLNKDIFAEITPNMTMNLPEGEYTLAVANNGWGGNAQIIIGRGQNTVVDLDQLKGDGPKMANILFQVDVEGAQVLIDNSPIDYSLPVEITYGRHRLTVIADGYDLWSRNLYVNSEEATIVISLSDEKSPNKRDNDSGNNSEDNSDSNTDNNTDNNTSNNSNDEHSPENHQPDNENSSTNSSEDSGTSDTGEKSGSEGDSELSDYLSTLSELLRSI